VPRLDPPRGGAYPEDVAPQPLDESTSSARGLSIEPPDAGGSSIPHTRPFLIKLHATRRGSAARPIAAVILGASLSVLAVAAWLKPNPAGMGTHTQLGLPPCTAVVVTGYPCPTCGMTTAFAHTVRGQLLAAFWAQPAGFALALATIAAAVLSAITVTTGLVPRVNWVTVKPTWVVLGLGAVILGGWCFKLVVGCLSGTLPVR